MKNLSIGMKVRVVATLEQLSKEGITRNKSTTMIRKDIAVIVASDGRGHYDVQFPNGVSFSFPRGYLRKATSRDAWFYYNKMVSKCSDTTSSVFIVNSFLVMEWQMKYVRIVKLDNGKFLVQGKNNLFEGWSSLRQFKDYSEAEGAAKAWKTPRIKSIIKYL